MPRFFFHVINGEFMPDTTGIECADAAAVKDQAVRITGEMINDQGLQLWKTGHFDMYVCDEKQKTHLKLSFSAEELNSLDKN